MFSIRFPILYAKMFCTKIIILVSCASILTHFIFFSFLSPLFFFLILFLRCGSHYCYSSNVIDDNAHPFSGRDRSHKCVPSINFNALLRIKSYVFHNVNNSLFSKYPSIHTQGFNESNDMIHSWRVNRNRKQEVYHGHDSLFFEIIILRV